jgi:hypothetical protein
MRLFISYAEDDRQFARAISRALRLDGHYISRSNYSGHWSSATCMHQIDEADAFIIVLSPGGIEEPVNKFERRYALSKDKQLIAVLLAEMPLPESLTDALVIDAAKMDGDQAGRFVLHVMDGTPPVDLTRMARERRATRRARALTRLNPAPGNHRVSSPEVTPSLTDDEFWEEVPPLPDEEWVEIDNRVEPHPSRPFDRKNYWTPFNTATSRNAAVQPQPYISEVASTEETEPPAEMPDAEELKPAETIGQEMDARPELVTDAFMVVEEALAGLRERYRRGEMTRKALEAELRHLMVLDEHGHWWALGVDSNRWYRYDGNTWTVANPYNGDEELPAQEHDPYPPGIITPVVPPPYHGLYEQASTRLGEALAETESEERLLDHANGGWHAPDSSLALQISVYYPEVLEGDHSYTLLLFVHRVGARDEVERIAAKHHDLMGNQPAAVRTDMRHLLLNNTRLTIVPHIEGITCTPAAQQLTWMPSHQAVIFAFRVPNHLVDEVRGHVTIYDSTSVVGEVRMRPPEDDDEEDAEA